MQQLPKPGRLAATEDACLPSSLSHLSRFLSFDIAPLEGKLSCVAYELTPTTNYGKNATPCGGRHQVRPQQTDTSVGGAALLVPGADGPSQGWGLAGKLPTPFGSDPRPVAETRVYPAKWKPGAQHR